MPNQQLAREEKQQANSINRISILHSLKSHFYVFLETLENEIARNHESYQNFTENHRISQTLTNTSGLKIPFNS
jgi:hypothetical protein